MIPDKMLEQATMAVCAVEKWDWRLPGARTRATSFARAALEAAGVVPLLAETEIAKVQASAFLRHIRMVEAVLAELVDSHAALDAIGNTPGRGPEILRVICVRDAANGLLGRSKIEPDNQTSR